MIVGKGVEQDGRGVLEALAEHHPQRVPVAAGCHDDVRAVAQQRVVDGHVQVGRLVRLVHPAVDVHVQLDVTLRNRVPGPVVRLQVVHQVVVVREGQTHGQHLAVSEADHSEARFAVPLVESREDLFAVFAEEFVDDARFGVRRLAEYDDCRRFLDDGSDFELLLFQQLSCDYLGCEEIRRCKLN